MNRAQQIEALAEHTFDVLVIGGGITGAGVALDAAARGLRVALVERSDFASGTSSRSSKLIHGGLRYLKQGQVSVTMESVRERERLLRNAPHLVQPLRFLLPHGSSFMASATYSAGLWLYDAFARAGTSRRHRHLDREQLRRTCPMLGDASGAFEYFDAMADDCRLVMHVLRRAHEFGAVIANYVSAESFPRSINATAEVGIRDLLGGGSFRLRAQAIVNATGIWADEVRRTFDSDARPLLRPSKGAHLVVDNRKLPLSEAIAVPKTSTGQHVFLVPWAGRTLVGTTDTTYTGSIDRPTADTTDVALLLRCVNEALPAVNLQRNDVISVYAGLRPLLSHAVGGDSRRAKRDYTIVRHGIMITVTGGKLTTYREMAERVVNLIAPSTTSTTASIELFAACDAPNDVPVDVAAHLLNAFGSKAPQIAALPNVDTRLVEDLPYTVAEVDHIVRHEMAMTVSDVLLRRLRLAQTDRDHGFRVAPMVAERIATHYGLNDDWRTESVRAFREDMAEFALPEE